MNNPDHIFKISPEFFSSFQEHRNHVFGLKCLNFLRRSGIRDG